MGTRTQGSKRMAASTIGPMPSGPVPSDRLVISRPYRDSNVGSNLASLAGAAWVADRLGRSLLVDWRGQSQLADASVNYFSEFFATPSELGGVAAAYATPDTPTLEEGEGGVWLTPGRAGEVAAAGLDPEADLVVLQPYHGLDRVHPGPESLRFALLRRLYQDVAPGAEVAEELERWRRRAFGGAFVVGVNVRTGNGAYFGAGMRYARRVDVSVFDDRRRFLRRIERACRDRVRTLPKPLRDGFVVFYATDSAWMGELLAELPNAVTRRTVFPPPGAGDLSVVTAPGHSDRDSVRDSLVDMFLLARCDALVYNSSLFNQYARVLTGNFSGNLVHLETLFPRQRLRMLAAGARRRLAGSVVR